MADETGLTAAPQVIAVVPESPAAIAGLKIGDVINEVSGTPPFDRDLEAQASPDLAVRAQEMLDGPAGRQGVELRVMRQGVASSIRLGSVAQCAGYTAVRVDGGREAYSDSRNVAVTTGMVEFVANEDELAFVLAHEIAHTVFGDSSGKKISRRAKERRADLFAAQLMRCAGYDPQAAGDFLKRLKGTDWQSAIWSPTHPGYDKRIAAIREFEGDLSCSDPATLEALTQKARS